MSRLNETTCVNNEKALSDALKQQFGIIILEGDVAEKVRESLKKYRVKSKFRSLSTWGMLVGLLFWPLLLASFATSLITADDLNNYKVEIMDDKVLLTHYKYKK